MLWGIVIPKPFGEGLEPAGITQATGGNLPVPPPIFLIDRKRMATEVIRCSECSTVFKGVPHWLANAKVTFTCTSCPKKGTRNLTRFEPPIETRSAVHDTDGDPDLDGVEIEDIDEADLDLGDEDLEADVEG